MKELTKVLTWLGIGLLISSFIVIDAVPGFAAMGVFTFCYIYDPKFRRMF